MHLLPEIIDSAKDIQDIRRNIHAHPELRFEENRTADLVAEALSSWGISVYRGMGKTGVVGRLDGDLGPGKMIGLRADMDALPLQEHNTFEHTSRNPGKMHACGHDGHTAMLLGAASYLAQHRNFDGIVYFIFQPAEEGRAGAKQMIDDGLFEQFPADCVFGLHNFPDIPLGHFAVKPGAMMAAFDCFEIIITGQATHAAMPHLGNDAIIAAAQLITALQTIVSRTLNPADPAVVSITQIHAGNTWNALPESVLLRGTFRCFNADIQKTIADKISQIVKGMCEGFNVSAEINFNPENPGYPVTFNTATETELALQAAIAVAGESGVDRNPVASMGSEDFAFMLQEKPGCYIWIGNGSSENSCLLHNPHYDFNDEILTIGAAYWVKLIEGVLG